MAAESPTFMEIGAKENQKGKMTMKNLWKTLCLACALSGMLVLVGCEDESSTESFEGAMKKAAADFDKEFDKTIKDVDKELQKASKELENMPVPDDL